MVPSTRNRTRQGPVNEEVNIITQAETLVDGIRSLQEELARLREENDDVKADLAAARSESKSAKSRAFLEQRVRDLEKQHRKDQRRIEQMQKKEARAEADDLGDIGQPTALPDVVYSMRKLLRKFRDLMMAPTLIDEGEECGICFDKMEKGKTSSLYCEHQICNICLAKISESNGTHETVRCPICRACSSRDDVEIVQLEETERWDALIEVAKAFSAIDREGSQDTSEEEREEQFIDDDDQTEDGDGSSRVSEDPPDDQEDEEPDEKIISDDESSQSSSPPLYQNSPIREKRKRMENLIAERSKKKARH